MPDSELVVPGAVDSHCHALAMREKRLPVAELLTRLMASGLRSVIDVGIRTDDLSSREALLSGVSSVSFTSGTHPSEVERVDADAQIEELTEQIERGRIVAVGEIGLDYHWDTGARSRAAELFERQVILAVASDLPVVIHNRQADEDVIAILNRHRPRGVMHCFSQDAAFCRRCLDLGLHISFGGNLTYKGSDDIRDAARTVPAAQLLVETDAPYLSPAPVRGRVNHPGHLGFTISALATLRGSDAEETAHLCGENAASLFGL